jgi:hypothetical protein
MDKLVLYLFCVIIIMFGGLFVNIYVFTLLDVGPFVFKNYSVLGWFLQIGWWIFCLYLGIKLAKADMKAREEI